MTDTKPITILHFNDVYNIDPNSKTEPIGGAARFCTAIKSFKHLDPLVLFSGDAFSPSMYFYLQFDNKPFLKKLNRLQKHKKSHKITNIKQFECLVDLMVKNPDIATGYMGFGASKMDFKMSWKAFSTTLNSLGPPNRTAEGWLKVWSDFKGKLKKNKKLVHDKKELAATGGGTNKLYQFSSLEEAAINVLSLRKAVDPLGKSFGVTAAQTSSTATETAEMLNVDLVEVDLVEDLENINTSTEATSVTKTNKKTKISKSKPPEDTRLELLKKQTVLLENIEKNSKDDARYLKNIYELKEKKFAKYQEYIHERLILEREKTKIKEETLNDRKRKLDVMLGLT